MRSASFTACAISAPAEQDRELVAAETRAGVARANLGFRAPRDFLQRLVAGQVAEAVVDLLEVDRCRS